MPRSQAEGVRYPPAGRRNTPPSSPAARLAVMPSPAGSDDARQHARKARSALCLDWANTVGPSASICWAALVSCTALLTRHLTADGTGRPTVRRTRPGADGSARCTAKRRERGGEAMAALAAERNRRLRRPRSSSRSPDYPRAKREERYCNGNDGHCNGNRKRQT